MGHARKWTFEPEIPRKDEFMVEIVIACSQQGFSAGARLIVKLPVHLKPQESGQTGSGENPKIHWMLVGGLDILGTTIPINFHIFQRG